MKNVKNHLRYRLYRVLLPSFFLCLFDLLWLWSKTKGSMKLAIKREQSYASFLNQGTVFIILCALLIALWLYQFYMIYLDLHANKNRILLLPQPRYLYWLCDALVYLAATLFVLLFHYLIYAKGFYLYQDMMLQETTFAYWQTRNVIASLYETQGFSLFYSNQLLTMLQSGLMLLYVSFSLPFAYTLSTYAKSRKYETVFQIGIWGIGAYVLMLSPNVWMKIGITLLVLVWMIWVLWDCWKSSRIGG